MTDSSDFKPDSLDLKLECLTDRVRHFYVAYSAGLDSTVLARLMQQQLNTGSWSLWHINHHLQPNADEMEASACHLAQSLGVDCRIDHVDLGQTDSNIEARARALRYDLFRRHIKADEAIVTAHHANDQAETLLLNLFRGSGPAGLRGIGRAQPFGEGQLFRPMLEFSRQQIEAFALSRNIHWIEDPSNNDLRFERNFIRHQLLPLLQSRWPSSLNVLNRTAQLQQQTQGLLEQLATIDLADVAIPSRFSRFSVIKLESLLRLGEDRQANLLRFWIRESGFQSVGHHKLQELMHQCHAAHDRQPLIEGPGYQLRIFNDMLYLVLTVEYAVKPLYRFALKQTIEIESISLSIPRSRLLQHFNRQDQGQAVTIRFRYRADDSLKPYRHHLKHLFQQHHVPTWLRDFIPQVYLNDELVGLWLPDYSAGL